MSKSGRSSVGRAFACQAKGRQFEPGRPLQGDGSSVGENATLIMWKSVVQIHLVPPVGS